MSAEASRNMQFGLRVRGRATGILMKKKEKSPKTGHDVQSNSLPDCFPTRFRILVYQPEANTILWVSKVVQVMNMLFSSAVYLSVTFLRFFKRED